MSCKKKTKMSNIIIYVNTFYEPNLKSMSYCFQIYDFWTEELIFNCDFTSFLQCGGLFKAELICLDRIRDVVRDYFPTAFISLYTDCQRFYDDRERLFPGTIVFKIKNQKATVPIEDYNFIHYLRFLKVKRMCRLCHSAFSKQKVRMRAID